MSEVQARLVQRDGFIDVMRAVLIVLVLVGHHIQFVLHGGSTDFWTDPVFKFIYIFHMPLFMAVSGYSAGFSLARSTVMTHARKKSLQLILPMAVWCAIGLLPDLLAHPDAVTIARSWVGSFLGSYWFLWAVFFSYIVARAALYLPLKPWISLAMAAAVLIALPVHTYVYCLTSYLFPFFAAGYLVHVSNHRIAPKTLRLVVLVPLACAIFVAWGPHTYIYNNRLQIGSLADAGDVLLMYLGGGVFSLLVLWALQGVYRALPRGRAMSGIVQMGQVTLQIYLVQDVYFRILRQAKIAVDPAVFWLAVVPVSLLFAGLVTLLVVQTGASRLAPLVWGLARTRKATARPAGPAAA